MVGLASVGLVGTASADERANDTPSADELNAEIRRTFKAGDTDRVRRLLEGQELEYDLTTTTVTEPEPASDADFGIQSRYSESNSELSTVVTSATRNNCVWFTVNMSLDSTHNRFRNARHVDDVVGIGFNDDHWSIIGQPYISVTDDYDVHSADFYSDSLSQGGLAGLVDLREAGQGPFPDRLPEQAYVTLQAQLQNLDDVPGTLWGSYEHTWASTSFGSISSISGGTGPLSVDLSVASTAWDIADPADPKRAL
ncbi:hypothetical protein [Halalkalicoccus tibetensis]|uniref:Uncharacterized protein n=1 Tax=Halalkalicoccus tibetensis TaxID=175632 RepID=A0ABD5V4W1_9EURY